MGQVNASQIWDILPCLIIDTIIMHTADVKYRAIVHYTHFCRSLRSVAKLYKVGKSTLARWVTASRRTDAAQMKHVRVACTRRRHAPSEAPSERHTKTINKTVNPLL